MEKEARAKRVFTFPGAITTESKVARSATTYAKRMDSGVGDRQHPSKLDFKPTGVNL